MARVTHALPRASFWSGKRVFITGHTGFKGGWLTLWLSQLGAILRGYALAPETEPDFFAACHVARHIEHQIADIRDAATLTAAMRDFAPEIVLHLAAQPLVRASYLRPMETYATNIMGTANVLDAVRQTPSVQVTIVVTSDKVYAESAGVHDETSRLGGHDPYSASKAGAELVAASFPMPAGQRLATVRAGNVIGGGDWAEDRLLPDFFRAIMAGELLTLRHPAAVRPWQHVLEPLCGYLVATEYMWAHEAPRESWNFGPDPNDSATVQSVAARLCALWGQGAFFTVAPDANPVHEAQSLRLRSEKAWRDLAWRPSMRLDDALDATVSWYRAFKDGADMEAFTLSQIRAFSQYE
ncbi:CDP-glucose 4,6-dehydratase [Acidocella sp. KAb 2-4]|uniref:CDP-glucose 4,6-dehydratase n=1 Tax=Acidocella sp. KAb 2-4 TaxID=2885158 RepID=UPI001D072DB0|nr:CDP-glucose 4,6-dehydratase [Acidocella sp. KAb 2-4]MCB5943653.1 CDP-glucose 4,6-dehydratase [Acidocella sp. KAb 2-4]